jgi:hypothetical protein
MRRTTIHSGSLPPRGNSTSGSGTSRLEPIQCVRLIVVRTSTSTDGSVRAQVYDSRENTERIRPIGGFYSWAILRMSSGVPSRRACRCTGSDKVPRGLIAGRSFCAIDDEKANGAFCGSNFRPRLSSTNKGNGGVVDARIGWRRALLGCGGRNRNEQSPRSFSMNPFRYARTDTGESHELAAGVRARTSSRQDTGNHLPAVPAVDTEVGIRCENHRIRDCLGHSHQAGIRQTHWNIGVFLQ